MFRLSLHCKRGIKAEIGSFISREEEIITFILWFSFIRAAEIWELSLFFSFLFVLIHRTKPSTRSVGQWKDNLCLNLNKYLMLLLWEASPFFNTCGNGSRSRSRRKKRIQWRQMKQNYHQNCTENTYITSLPILTRQLISFTFKYL